MSKPFHLFVSSSPDLEEEREALGRTVAELPVAIGWEIKHTPGSGDLVDEALEFIAACDLYLILMGADFCAPMGLEWQRSQRTLKLTHAFAKNELHSPSAREMLRQKRIAWSAFESPQELADRVTQMLARLLLDHGEEFGLYVDDVEGLLPLVEGGDEREERPDERRGAGRGGVILGRETHL
jgi:hypothetical protein